MDEETLSAGELQERLEALYRPGGYAEGEELCLTILEEIDPDWEPARLYLLLFLCAQDAYDDALGLAEELSDDSLFSVLEQLAFSEATDTDCRLYREIQLLLRERGLEKRLTTFFGTFEKPWPRADISTALRMWE